MSNPLVSIPIITYNSSEYIIEGLESVKAQTYKNLELIISDDCSIDNTVELCREWLEKNKGHFVRTELVTTDKNTGVAGNCNRAVRACQGEWIKMLSGDDKFLPYTIERYVRYALMHPEASIIFGKFMFYGPDEEYTNECKRIYETNFYPKIQLEQSKQYIEDLKCLFVPGPGLIYKKSLWEHVGGYDERYQFCEEDPFMHKIFKAGYRIYFLDEEIYGYQIRKESLGRNDDGKNLILTRHSKDRIQYFYDVRKNEMIKSKLYLHAWDLFISFGLLLAKDTHSKFKVFMYKTLKFTSPLRYKRKFNNLV